MFYIYYHAHHGRLITRIGIGINIESDDPDEAENIKEYYENMDREEINEQIKNILDDSDIRDVYGIEPHSVHSSRVEAKIVSLAIEEYVVSIELPFKITFKII